MKKIFLIVPILLISLVSLAQTKKTTAYIFEDYIFESYNAVKKLNAEIEKKQETFQTEFNKLALEYQNANLDYQESMKNITLENTQTINDKIKKVQQIKEAAENYQRNSEKELQEFIGTNVLKIKDEIQEATTAVAKTKGVIYVFTRNKADSPMSRQRVVLYADDTKTQNLSDDVIKYLNAKVK